MELWKPVVGFKRHYEVSNMGRVRRIGGKVLKADAVTARYPLVQLCVRGKRTTRNIHVLVLLAFVGPRPGRNFEANHKDGNKRNPALLNLEWTTKKENMRHAVTNGLIKTGVASPFAVVTGRMIREIRFGIQDGLSQRRIARLLGISQKTVWRYARV